VVHPTQGVEIALELGSGSAVATIGVLEGLDSISASGDELVQTVPEGERLSALEFEAVK
jgi:hypothetical protein